MTLLLLFRMKETSLLSTFSEIEIEVVNNIDLYHCQILLLNLDLDLNICFDFVLVFLYSCSFTAWAGSYVSLRISRKASCFFEAWAGFLYSLGIARKKIVILKLVLDLILI